MQNLTGEFPQPVPVIVKKSVFLSIGIGQFTYANTTTTTNSNNDDNNDIIRIEKIRITH